MNNENLKINNLEDSNFSSENLKNFEIKSLTNNDTFIADNYQILPEEIPVNFSIQSCFSHIYVTNLGTNIIIETNKFDAYWYKEKDEILESKNEAIKKITIKLHQLVSKVILSRNLLNNAPFNIKEYIKKNVYRKFLEEMDNVVLFGNGEEKPLGLLNEQFSLKKEEDKIFGVEITKNIFSSLFQMEIELPHIYKKESKWILTRNLFLEITKNLLETKNNLYEIIKDEIGYKLFGRRLFIVDVPVETNIEAILIHPSAYTIVEDTKVDIIENQQDIDIKYIFLKNFGGNITNKKAIIFGIKNIKLN